MKKPVKKPTQKSDLIDVDPQTRSDYVALLNSTKAQLESILYELESATTNRIGGKPVPSDLVFDTVPLIRQLKASCRFIDESLFTWS